MRTRAAGWRRWEPDRPSRPARRSPPRPSKQGRLAGRYAPRSSSGGRRPPFADSSPGSRPMCSVVTVFSYRSVRRSELLRSRGSTGPKQRTRSAASYPAAGSRSGTVRTPATRRTTQSWCRSRPARRRSHTGARAPAPASRAGAGVLLPVLRLQSGQHITGGTDRAVRTGVASDRTLTPRSRLGKLQPHGTTLHNSQSEVAPLTCPRAHFCDVRESAPG